MITAHSHAEVGDRADPDQIGYEIECRSPTYGHQYRGYVDAAGDLFVPGRVDDMRPRAPQPAKTLALPAPRLVKV
jgi:hypothetical protein